MKHTNYFITFSLLFFAVQQGLGQEIKVGDVVRLNSHLEVEGNPKIIFPNDKTNNITTDYLGEYLYKVEGIDTLKVQLSAIPFKSYKPKREARRKKRGFQILSNYYNNKIYTVGRKDFDKSAKLTEIIKRNRITFGVVTVPYKARLTNGGLSFDTEFSLNTTLNVKIYNSLDNSYSISLLLGSGIGNVGLNSKNAPGIGENNAIDVATLSFLGGVMYEYNKIQVGLYCGLDYINNQTTYKWDGNGKMWFGLGIGYSIFGILKEGEKNR